MQTENTQLATLQKQLKIYQANNKLPTLIGKLSSDVSGIRSAMKLPLPKVASFTKAFGKNAAIAVLGVFIQDAVNYFDIKTSYWTQERYIKCANELYRHKGYVVNLAELHYFFDHYIKLSKNYHRIDMNVILTAFKEYLEERMTVAMEVSIERHEDNGKDYELPSEDAIRAMYAAMKSKSSTKKTKQKPTNKNRLSGRSDFVKIGVVVWDSESQNIYSAVNAQTEHDKTFYGANPNIQDFMVLKDENILVVCDCTCTNKSDLFSK